MKWIVFLALMSMISLSTAVLAQSDIHKEAIRKIEAGDPEWAWETGGLDLDSLMAKNRIPGMSIAVIEDFEIAWTREYGLSRIEGNVKVAPTTLFQAASISKPVAAMAVLHAVEHGRFGLDDPINDLLTSWRLPENELTANRAVTPRMLLSHTAGTTVHGFRGYLPGDALPTLREVLAGTGKAKSQPVVVDIEPFTEYRYSGGGYTLMALAMEDVHGEKMEDILARSVLGPIGMTHSTFARLITGEDTPNVAHAFGGRMKAPWHVYPEQSAAGLWTTPTDLAKFAIAVQKMLRGDEGGVLSRAMAQAMVTPTEAGGSYGLGFSQHLTGAGSKFFTHGGVNWGFVCRLIAHTENGYGVVMMTNGDKRGNMPQEILRRVAVTHGWDG